MGKEHRNQIPAQRLQGNYVVNSKTGCWEWRHTISNLGYGKIGYQYKVWSAHRLSWIAHRGTIPDGLNVLHRCDVRHCINPDHLFLGTHQENMKDRNAKGRCGATRGIANHNSKLNPEKAFAIRWRAAIGHKQRDLAKDYGVTQRAVAQVIHNKTWQQEAHD